MSLFSNILNIITTEDLKIAPSDWIELLNWSALNISYEAPHWGPSLLTQVSMYLLSMAMKIYRIDHRKIVYINKSIKDYFRKTGFIFFYRISLNKQAYLKNELSQRCTYSRGHLFKKSKDREEIKVK